MSMTLQIDKAIEKVPFLREFEEREKDSAERRHYEFEFQDRCRRKILCDPNSRGGHTSIRDQA